MHMVHLCAEIVDVSFSLWTQVEYMLVYLDHEQKKAQLLLKAQPLLEILMKEEAANPKYVCDEKNL